MTGDDAYFLRDHIEKLNKEIAKLKAKLRECQQRDVVKTQVLLNDLPWVWAEIEGRRCKAIDRASCYEAIRAAQARERER